MALLDPQEIIVKTLRGDERKYVISRFPAIPGREIVAGYPLTSVPKVGDYAANEAIMLKLMCFVGVPMPNGDVLELKTRALVDNHVPDYETLVRIEIEMMKYNTSFFGNGEISTFFANTVRTMLVKISPMLTHLSGQLSEAIKQRSANLKQN